MAAATATIALRGPRRALSRWNRACRELALTRTAHQALCTRTALSHGAPVRRRVERRLPALSSLRGQSPAQEIRWPAVGKRLMSMLISEITTAVDRGLNPGMVVRRCTVS